MHSHREGKSAVVFLLFYRNCYQLFLPYGDLPFLKSSWIIPTGQGREWHGTKTLWHHLHRNSNGDSVILAMICWSTTSSSCSSTNCKEAFDLRVSSQIGNVGKQVAFFSHSQVLFIICLCCLLKFKVKSCGSISISNRWRCLIRQVSWLLQTVLAVQRLVMSNYESKRISITNLVNTN